MPYYFCLFLLLISTPTQAQTRSYKKEMRESGFDIPHYSHPERQRLLIALLEMPETDMVFQLSDALRRQVAVRLIDKTPNRFFLKTGDRLGYYKPFETVKKLYVRFFDDFPFNFNAGAFRDLIISQVKQQKKDVYEMDVYLSTFTCSGNEKTAWHWTVLVDDSGEKPIATLVERAMWD